MDASHPIHALLKERILILDGAMGTMIQMRGFTEADFRGERFKDHPVDIKNNNEALLFTQPDAIEEIHFEYLEAGADIIETNTFNANAVSMADFQMEPLVYEMNVVAAHIARRAVKRALERDPYRPRFVAGAIGPMNRTLSIADDPNDPGKRKVTFDQVMNAYLEQVKGLMDGGVDILLPETTFDPLNLKAALFAIQKYFDEGGRRVPVMASLFMLIDGRTLTGQTLEACWNAISHAPLLSFGLNCSLGPKEMRPYVEELSALCPIYTSAYPNAGMPNPLLPTNYS